MTNIEYVNALRKIADFYEANPDTKTPYPRLHVFTDSKEEFLLNAIALSHGGKVVKSADKSDASWACYHAMREFSGVTIDIEIRRSLVCRLVTPAVYDCPDSLLEEASDYTEGTK